MLASAVDLHKKLLDEKERELAKAVNVANDEHWTKISELTNEKLTLFFSYYIFIFVDFLILELQNRVGVEDAIDVQRLRDQVELDSAREGQERRHAQSVREATRRDTAREQQIAQFDERFGIVASRFGARTREESRFVQEVFEVGERAHVEQQPRGRDDRDQHETQE